MNDTVEFDDIPGGFMPLDQTAFTWILQYQNRMEPPRADVDAARTMLRANGVVVFDDYRKAGTLGVAAAMWEAILDEGLKPFLNTDFKLYATWGDPAPLLAEMARRAVGENWCKLTGPVMVRDVPVLHLSRKNPVR